MKQNLILLHGYGEDSTIWSGFVPFLQKEYFIITPDYSRLSNLKTIDDYAEFVHQEIVAKGVEKCIVIGHSMGGYVALAFAEKYPTMLKGLGLFHSTAFEDSEDKKATRTKSIEYLAKHGSEAFIRFSTPNLYSEGFQKLHPEVIEKHIVSASQIPVEALMAGMAAMRDRPDKKAVLKSIKCFVMFIIGEKDKSVSPADAKAQIMIPKFFTSSILNDVAHLGMIEDPEECLKFVSKFLLKCL